MGSSQALINKYRPTSFEACIGNEACIKALADAVRGPTRPHAYLFTGVSGIGKTTLARIIATEVGAIVNEIDAASKSGVDDTKLLVDMAGFKPLELDGKKNVLYIIDECGSLSSRAWEPLLKLVEEPPDYLYIALCTTETQKVPKTHITRAYPVALKALKPKDIEALITTVADLEGWKVADGVFQSIVLASEGSARLALNILQAGHAAKDKNELSEILLEIESEENPAVKLITHLMRGQKNWKGVSQLLAEINGNEEEAINASSNWLAKALVTSDEEQAKEFWTMLRAFTETNTWNKKIHYYTAIGKILWGQLPF